MIEQARLVGLSLVQAEALLWPGSYVKVIDPDETAALDAKILELRDAAISRLATALDIPADVLTGLAETQSQALDIPADFLTGLAETRSHWSALLHDGGAGVIDPDETVHKGSDLSGDVPVVPQHEDHPNTG